MAEFSLVQPGRGTAFVAVIGLVALLAVLPTVVAVGPKAIPEVLAVGLAGLAAVIGGVKLVALAWGLAARFETSAPGVAAPASLD